MAKDRPETRRFYKTFQDLFGRIPPLSNDAKVMLGFLVFEADSNGYWDGSMRGLAQSLDIGFRAAKEAAAELVSANEIEFTPSRGGLKGGQTRFILLAGKTSQLPGFMDEKPRRPKRPNAARRAANKPLGALHSAAREAPVCSAEAPVCSARAYIPDCPITDLSKKGQNRESENTIHLTVQEIERFDDNVDPEMRDLVVKFLDGRQWGLMSFNNRSMVADKIDKHGRYFVRQALLDLMKDPRRSLTAAMKRAGVMAANHDKTTFTNTKPGANNAEPKIEFTS